MRRTRLAGETLLVIGVGLIIVLMWNGMKEDNDMEVKVNARLSGPLSYDDPDLIHLVNSRLIHQPSTLPYNLVVHRIPTDNEAQQYYLFKTEQAHSFYTGVIRELFDGVENGFFVEAGALDGEFLSNTLRLEQEAGWMGLLVEPNLEMFNQLLEKHRRVWASQSCLATQTYPHREILIRYGRSGNNPDALLDGFADAHSLLAGLTDGAPLDGSSGGYRSYESVQCLPLATLLLALNITRVDLVSLDVEGAEVGVLRHFPWGRVTVDVWVVEHATPTLSTPPKPMEATDSGPAHTNTLSTYSSRSQTLFTLTSPTHTPPTSTHTLSTLLTHNHPTHKPVTHEYPTNTTPIQTPHKHIQPTHTSSMHTSPQHTSFTHPTPTHTSPNYQHNRSHISLKDRTSVPYNDIYFPSDLDMSLADHNFIQMFALQGYELYKVHIMYGIGNYVFILKNCEVYKKLKKQ